MTLRLTTSTQRCTWLLMSAPASSSIWTMASSPRTQAYMRGVIPCRGSRRRKSYRLQFHWFRLSQSKVQEFWKEPWSHDTSRHTGCRVTLSKVKKERWTEKLLYQDRGFSTHTTLQIQYIMTASCFSASMRRSSCTVWQQRRCQETKMYKYSK